MIGAIKSSFHPQPSEKKFPHPLTSFANASFNGCNQEINLLPETSHVTQNDIFEGEKEF